MAHNEGQGRVVAKFILHAYEPPNGDEFVTILMDDKVFQIRPHEPYEMSADSNGRLLDYPAFYMYQILNTYAGLYGLVEVQSRRERNGIVLDVDTAEREAAQLLERNRWQHIEAWVNHQLNERVKDGKSVLPPSGFVAESIKHLNIDLPSRYGMKPVGWDWKPDTSRPVVSTADLGLVVSNAPDMGEEIAVLRAEIEQRDRKLSKLESQIQLLLDRIAPPADAEPEAVSSGGPVGKTKR